MGARATPAEIIRVRAAIWTEARTALTEFIQGQLVQGTDFGKIMVTGKDGREHESKPTLFKPGAEKICGLFGWTARFARDKATHEMLGSPANTICYICRLIDPAGQIVGEGRGACTIGEGRTKTANSAIKMAQKRAKVDAVLSAAQLSEFFTQDLEDDPPVSSTNGAASAQPGNPNWAAERTEREQLTHEIEQMRNLLRWSPERFGEICKENYGVLVSQMNMDQIHALHQRMSKATANLKP